MAEKPKELPDEGKKSSGAMKKIVLVVGGLVLLAAVGGGGFFAAKAMSGSAATEAEDAAPAPPVKKPRPMPPERAGEDDEYEDYYDAMPDTGVPPVFVPVDVFTVNLKGPDGGLGDHYLQVDVRAQLGGDKTADATLKAYLPAIQHEVLMLLSSKTPEEIRTPEGKAKLTKDIRRAINRAARTQNLVVNVVFTRFVIQ